MTATMEQLEAFTAFSWATPYLNSSNWVIRPRSRGFIKGIDADCFCRDTVWANNGVQQWLELFEKPDRGGIVRKSLSLCKLGPGLMGYPGIAHGGALLTLMDEALCYIIVAVEQMKHNVDFLRIGEREWRKSQLEGKSVQEILVGRLVTANMDVKFLKPVPCPGVVGIQVDVLEDKKYKMTIRGVMRDAKGTPLMQVDALWVKLGGVSKI